MWVQLRVCKQSMVQGKLTNLQPGDWCEVGKQTALLWIGNGDAWVPPAAVQRNLAPTNAGVVVRAAPAVAHEHLKGVAAGLAWQDGGIEMPFAKTLIWNPASLVRPELVLVGFHLLETWQVAVPMCKYDILASTLGSKEEREATAKVIRDLRVPVYETNVIFVRQCEETAELLQDWRMQLGKGNERLAFLRSLYRVKPLILALPYTWTQPE